MPDYHKILLIQTAFLGDAILTTPLLWALKQTYTKAEIDVLCIPQTATIFKSNPHIHQLMVFDKRKKFNRIASTLATINELKKHKYDLAVSAQISFTTSMLMYLSGIPNRLGFPRQKLLTMTIDLPKGIPVGKRYLRLMTALTENTFSAQTELFWDNETEQQATQLLNTFCTPDNTIVGIAPGSVWKTKRWLTVYYSELIAQLDSNNIKTVLLGGPEEHELCQLIANNSHTNPLNLCGKTSITGSAAVIKRLNLLVTNDSAPMHLANAVKTDVIAIFGPTVKQFGFFPTGANDKVLEIDLACRPCGKHGSNHCPQKHSRCMTAITPDIVLKEVLKRLGR
jgi:heptosyltransferase-2